MLPIDQRQRRGAQGHEPPHAAEIGHQTEQGYTADPRSAVRAF
jgi:hypothetical protein